ncbi:hypothetical protein [Streptomyces sp. NPDC059759]|uniref:hypothetical protein n=1 Tax=Streptomyces sp. NPDC059759 TaxID=3346936 RepID=UPI00365D9671
MVHFDVVHPQPPVDAGEVKVADLTLKSSPHALNLLDLALAEFRITLSDQRPADEKPSLNRRAPCVVDFVGLGWEKVKFAGADAARDGLRRLQHLVLTLSERHDHTARGLTAASPPAGVGRIVGCKVGGLAADAVRGPEAWKSESFGAMKGKRSQQLGQFLNLGVAGPQFAPAVPHHQCSSQYELVLSPHRAPHEQYRMSVRRDGGCVLRTDGRAAHLVTSRCQWGLSPSVMVDSKMRLPLYVCKEGA